MKIVKLTLNQEFLDTNDLLMELKVSAGVTPADLAAAVSEAIAGVNDEAEGIKDKEFPEREER